jgi:Tfp pilus assembly protein PilV
MEHRLKTQGFTLLETMFASVLFMVSLWGISQFVESSARQLSVQRQQAELSAHLDNWTASLLLSSGEPVWTSEAVPNAALAWDVSPTSPAIIRLEAKSAQEIIHMWRSALP